MKKNLLFFAMVFVASTMSLLTGCQNDETSLQNDITQIDYSQPPYLSENKQVQAELEFLVKSNKSTEESLKDLEWLVSSTPESNDLDLQGYSFGDSDMIITSRKNLQDQMNHESNNSLAKYFMCLLIDCQNDETSTTEQTQQIDPQVLKLSSDPIVQKELMFIKEKMGYNLSKIYVLKGELSGDYGLVEGAGWDAITIPGEYVRDAMKRAEKQLKPEANVRHKVLSLFGL